MKKVNTLCVGCLCETPYGSKVNVREGQWECPKCQHWNPNYFLAEESKPKSDDSNHRDYNVGKSDYAKHKIQPWDIWEEYELDPWRADIVKRILRNKEDEDPVLDLEKIKHICDKLIDMEKKKNG